MKINIVVNSFPTVSETFLFNLVVGLENSGHDVLVCSINESNDLSYYSKRIDLWSGAKVVYGRSTFHFLFAFFFKKTLRSQRRILKLRGHKFKTRLSILKKLHFVSQKDPDVIHFSFSGIAAEFHQAIEIQKTSKIIISCRGSAEKVRPLVDPSRAKKLESVFNSSDRIHCVSEDMRQTVLRYGANPNNTFINYPSIDPSMFVFNKRRHEYLTTESKPFRILSTGRLHFQKGYVYALNAVKTQVDSGLNIKYDICGGGPEEGLLRYMVQELSLESVVKIHGKVSSSTVLELLESADIFLLPSIYEGIANAALEAMASGVPVLTTDAGGMDEVVTDRVNGVIVPRFDSSRLADGIGFLYKNPAEALMYAERALETLRLNFQITNQIRVFESEYQACSQSI